MAVIRIGVKADVIHLRACVQVYPFVDFPTHRCAHFAREMNRRARTDCITGVCLAAVAQGVYIGDLVDRVENGLRVGGEMKEHFAVIRRVVDAVSQTYRYLVCHHLLHAA